MPSHSRLPDLHSLDLLDDCHRQILQQAVRKVLATDVAETTYAQILDGLPTETSISESFPYAEDDHPVFANKHREICPGFTNKVLTFREQFEISTLRFQVQPLLDFQKASPGSKAFNLRLVELVAVACHQIGAFLYELDQGAHQHELYQNWRRKVIDEQQRGCESRRYSDVATTAFSHRVYDWPELYPRGFADVAGYWAESKIFGGVLVFDRGQTEKECNAVWIHSDLHRGPETLYPPTDDQLTSLIKFLTDTSTKLPYPFPIRASPLNRPRWDSYYAFKYYHLFRDRYERKVPDNPPRVRCVNNSRDWPELRDQQILMLEGLVDEDGVPYNAPGDASAAATRIRNITPSSPLWHSFGNQADN